MSYLHRTMLTCNLEFEYFCILFFRKFFLWLDCGQLTLFQKLTLCEICEAGLMDFTSDPFLLDLEFAIRKMFFLLLSARMFFLKTARCFAAISALSKAGNVENVQRNRRVHFHSCEAFNDLFCFVIVFQVF